MMSEHTKEPWRTKYRTMEAIQIWSDYERLALVDTCGGDGPANARRIVACVNACAGISTEELERGVIKEALGMVDRLSREITALPTDCAGQNCAACANPCEEYLEHLR